MNSHRLLIIITLSFILLIHFSGCNDDSEAMRESQERAVANQQIENPFFASPPMQDIEVDDEELLRFVNLGISLGRIQAEARQEMLDLLNEKELSVDVYNSINHALSMGFSLDDYDFSEANIEKYYEVAERMTEIEQSIESRFETAISQAGFSEERFLDLNIAMQHNMELMERSKNLLMKNELEMEE